MLEKKTWEEFRKTGLLWWINMILHTFGWVIVVAPPDDDSGVEEVYPARARFRGFDEESNTKGYINVSKFMVENAEKLLEESKE